MLIAAAQHGRHETLAFLMERGLDPNVVDEKHKFTPLHFAARYAFILP